MSCAPAAFQPFTAAVHPGTMAQLQDHSKTTSKLLLSNVCGDLEVWHKALLTISSANMPVSNRQNTSTPRCGVSLKVIPTVPSQHCPDDLCS